MLYFIIIVTFIILYLFLKENPELSSLNEYLRNIKRKVSKEEKEKLKHVRIHLTDTDIGYCINSKDIGIYRSYGKKYNVSQKDVLNHEIAHILSGESNHTKKFWNYYKYIKSL